MFLEVRKRHPSVCLEEVTALQRLAYILLSVLLLIFKSYTHFFLGGTFMEEMREIRKAQVNASCPR